VADLATHRLVMNINPSSVHRTELAVTVTVILLTLFIEKVLAADYRDSDVCFQIKSRRRIGPGKRAQSYK
jgi:hypothetical protein